jgi:rhomboid protease GluP
MMLLGQALEKSIGHLRFLIFYVLTGVAANFATYLFYPLTFIHVGASGAVFGFLGLYVYVAVFKKNLITRQKTIMIYSLTICGVIMTFIQPGINHAGHIGGLIAGLLLAPMFIRKADWF